MPDRASELERIAKRYEAGADHLKQFGRFLDNDLDSPNGYYMASQLREIAARIRNKNSQVKVRS